MKNILFFFILCFFSNIGLAECNWNGIHIWPKKDRISHNSIFVIEGYSQSQHTIRHLKFGQIYLKSGAAKIPLKIVKIIEGQFALTQAILKPTEPLIIGMKYELLIDRLEFPDDDYTPRSFFVAYPNDNNIPKWLNSPHYIGKSYARFGCGPAKSVSFCVKYEDVSPTLVYTKVYSKELKSSSEYYLTSENNILGIGHGMCSGAFIFSEDSTYDVRFSLMDASGNESETLTEPISYSKPTIEDEGKSIKSCECKQSVINKYVYLIIPFIILIVIVVWVPRGSS